MTVEQNQIVARLILNTKRNKRLNNLVDIADDIDQLANELGGINKVAQLIGLSTDMLNQFLSVKKLAQEVKGRVKLRELDGVSVVNYITKYNNEDQAYLANEYVKGVLNSQDIRAIGPLKTNFPSTPISELAKKVQTSKNIKVSVFYVQLPKKLDIQSITSRIENVIGSNNIISIEVKGLLGIIKLTKEGENILRQKIKEEKGETLKTFLQSLLKT